MPLAWLKRHLEKGLARRVPLGRLRRPLLVFTDGACEPSPGTATGLRAGHGAVVYDPESTTARYFGGQCGDPIMRRFTKEGATTQVVGQAELLPCIAAKELWSDLFKERLVIWFIDNDAARFCLIKGGPRPRNQPGWPRNSGKAKSAVSPTRGSDASRLQAIGATTHPAARNQPRYSASPLP